MESICDDTIITTDNADEISRLPENDQDPILYLWNELLHVRILSTALMFNDNMLHPQRFENYMYIMTQSCIKLSLNVSRKLEALQHISASAAAIVEAGQRHDDCRPALHSFCRQLLLAVSPDLRLKVGKQETHSTTECSKSLLDLFENLRQDNAPLIGQQCVKLCEEIKTSSVEKVVAAALQLKNLLENEDQLIQSWAQWEFLSFEEWEARQSPLS